MIIFRLIILIHLDQVVFSPEKMSFCIAQLQEILENVFQKVVNTITLDFAVKVSRLAAETS